MKSRRVAAIFDIEGTLFRGQMGRGFIAYARRNGRAWHANLYFLGIMPKYLGYLTGIIPARSLNHDAIQRMPLLIRGYTQAQADQAYRWVAHEYILPSAYPDILERWWYHQQRGHHTFIVSGGLDPCVAHIADELKADGYWGTKVEEAKGKLSGRIIPPVVIGEGKRQAVHRMVELGGFEVDWSASYAYADSLHDLSVLEMVGHPVAVYPDDRLAQIAGKRGWKIIQRED
jgi:HAD superfamily hydrolase (TIGR01490 family)